MGMTDTNTASGAADLTDTVCKALRRSWHLGQTYWQQADSESFAQNKKAETTHAAFVALLDDTRAALASAPAQSVAEPGTAYAALPDEPLPNDEQIWAAREAWSKQANEHEAMRAALIAGRASHGQAPAHVLHLVNDAFAEDGNSYEYLDAAIAAQGDSNE